MQSELYALLPEAFTVYLARHASPDRSRIDIPYHIPPGPELTEQGRAEAAELGAFFEQAGVRLLIASPLERTQRTAAIAAGACGAAVGTSYDIAEWRPEENEPVVLERTQRVFVTAAWESHGRGEPVGLVTHGGPILALMKALGVPAGAVNALRIYDNRNPISPAGAWRVERSDGCLALELVFIPQGYALPAPENRRFVVEIEAEESPALSSD